MLIGRVVLFYFCFCFVLRFTIRGKRLRYVVFVQFHLRGLRKDMDRAQKDKFPGSLIFLEPSVEGACRIVIGSKISGVVILIMHIMNFAGQVNIGVVGVPPGVNLILGKDRGIFSIKITEIISISGDT